MSELVKEKRIARSTGVEVELIDASHPDCTDFDPDEGGRWVTYCREHDQFCQHTTWRSAREHLGHPEEWCEPCAESDPGGSDGGFSAEERQRALETRRLRAAERREERDAEQRKRDAERDLEAQWTHWTVSEPMTDRVYLPAEREQADEARAERAAALQAVQKAKEARRQGEEALAKLPKVKSRKEKKNRERLEAEVSAADEIVVAKEDIARIAKETVQQFARIASLRGYAERGWKLRSIAGHRLIQKGDRQVYIPDDYLPAEAYSAVERSKDDA